MLGDRAPAFEDLAQLGYLDQILKESLRLWPTAPAFALRCLDDETVIGGRYRIRHDQIAVVLIPQLHRDPAVWGERAEEFDPDRFAFERAEQLPPNSWKPFGNGQRSCIGRGFALQEATLFLAMMLQRFDLSAADPNYQLKIKQTLTIKPDGLHMYARRRPVTIVDAGSPAPQQATAPDRQAVANGIPIRVLYGSNAGTSQAFAQRIANDARARGYTASVDTLDSAAGHLPTDGAVVIVTSSYEGQPPDNARDFVSWVQTAAARRAGRRALRRVRLRQQGLGPHLPGHPQGGRRGAGRGRGPAAGRARRGQRPRRLLRRVRGLVRGVLGPGRRPSSTSSPTLRRRPRRCRWSSSAGPGTRSCGRTGCRWARSWPTASWWT